ncbi:MAG: hypothetical protein GX585_05095, partial [Clostridiales bacterium]|nr:hypothetical protein [Clostridiales bacterium]
YHGSRAVCHLRADGQTRAADPYTCWGYLWDRGPDITMDIIPDEKKANYISCVELLREGRPKRTLTYNADVGGARQRSAIGLKDGALCLWCSHAGETPEALRDRLHGMGWESAVMLDGGGSSQCDFAGRTLTSARKVHNLILAYLRKEEKPMGTKTVCLDPGHDASNRANASPDGSYYEHAFALDMGLRMEAVLARHGVAVTMTRTGGEAVSQERRVQIANAVDELDLFVSLHSNAAGNDGWSPARGWCIYTSSAGATAGRNRAANAIIARVSEAGILTRGSVLNHSMFYVLRNTVAPAVLIEHGFHTNQEDTALLLTDAYRNKLAEAQCKGILDYLGIAWEEAIPQEAGSAAPSDWACESWEKATKTGVFDGTDPQGAMTREMAAVVLDRLKLI